ncbi:integral membrane protein S linking to the trans Golgi network-domain-containing protein [Pseudomassariella vexata]|uniref:Integral membrane protein S linking to the trans Golgi network-domain-containing protein n=1 Tax=Pseudomassariella vexata TaxID=1141098 RepID=A0A1Y2DNF8_9PEZI|nr:integral membrane protein S linking to the trans Golgi network-domain-containing protein [Pseudomassariella vexata]ORY60801.1 integral membrane protein S linking to the trans Golgi network-domain-containing protein [Pseudomassariella vexata]
MPRRRRPPRSGAITELPPLRILAQIAALQSIYYAVALILMLFTTLVAGSKFSLDLVFGWISLRGDTTQGWLMAFVWMCCAGAVVIAIVALIQRSKLVPDFALSLHFIHLIIVSLYTGFVPRHAMWWATMACSSAATVALGMWGCRWRELQPISFGGSGGNRDQGAATENGHAAGGDDVGAEDDEEMGFSRGRGRGRGRDGAGEYEMTVGMRGSDAR